MPSNVPQAHVLQPRGGQTLLGHLASIVCSTRSEWQRDASAARPSHGHRRAALADARIKGGLDSDARALAARIASQLPPLLFQMAPRRGDPCLLAHSLPRPSVTPRDAILFAFASRYATRKRLHVS